ncbi:restriction endonuclease [Gimesia chilikensis]|uniref:restriction endonuclease n=1 Tax=Gimesia chilikensis TaxID=2605989 RepID=UPI003A9553D4
MPEFHQRPDSIPNFVGRENEIEWLFDFYRHRGNFFTPVIVQGPGGVGKTTLLKQFLASTPLTFDPSWLDLSPFDKPHEAINSFMERLATGRDQNFGRRIVVLDGVERMDDSQISSVVNRIFNWKAVRGLIISSRRRITLKPSETLELLPLELDAAKKLLELTTDLKVEPHELERLVTSVNCYPLAIQLLAGLIRSNSSDDISRLITGNFYDLSDVTSAPSSEILVVTKPKLITTSEALVNNLKKQPENVRDLSPRDFENLLAELLTDMGWEVEVTKQTRDGGKDILAYMNTDLGRFLCLVEAKRYREDRKIGVDLVRTLFGTLCDFQANSAMMVTTSTFSRDAQEFQQRHQYQLSLRDYADIVQWITQYKSESSN